MNKTCYSGGAVIYKKSFTNVLSTDPMMNQFLTMVCGNLGVNDVAMDVFMLVSVYFSFRQLEVFYMDVKM